MLVHCWPKAAGLQPVVAGCKGVRQACAARRHVQKLGSRQGSRLELSQRRLFNRRHHLVGSNATLALCQLALQLFRSAAVFLKKAETRLCLHAQNQSLVALQDIYHTSLWLCCRDSRWQWQLLPPFENQLVPHCTDAQCAPAVHGATVWWVDEATK